MERPVPGRTGNAQFGSDAIAETLRALDIPYIALNPGASFRGLHDSIVNHLGNVQPQLLVCLHEEHAVALAHGYAKVTGKAIAAAVHANVGLMHATMAIFNAWCDRMPVLVIGATGPVDAARRRPWIDWIHTARDQGALVRNFVKWDDQPASAAAAREALLRAYWIAQAAPKGPAYVNLDSEMQEAALAEPLPPIRAARYLDAPTSGLTADAAGHVAEALGKAERPLILAGRCSRSEAAWTRRVQFAEHFGARVVTDLKVPAAFPTTHGLHVGDFRGRTAQRALAAMREADLIVSLDWLDFGGALTAAFGNEPPQQLIQVSLDHQLHNGWSMDHQAHPPADSYVACDPDVFVGAVLQSVGLDPSRAAPMTAPAAREMEAPDVGPGPITVERLAHTLRRSVGGRPVTLTHLPLSWDGAFWPIVHPLDYLGSDGGGGLGAGPGNSVGAALALRDLGMGRLPVAVCGDGDFLMGATALWTAVHYGIPLLLVVANNRSFFNDEVHQERMARMRGRPVENKWIGQRMTDPPVALAKLAEAQGCQAFGPVERAEELAAAFAAAIAAVEAGGVAVVEVIVEPGYSTAHVAALTRGPAQDKG